ncbi:DinB family protein [Sinomicrobium weinanense]|uniref:DinB family protein n=1 Tax=Sinomicrobium weinanense TaxID=2842200 RepID=A0A926JRY9_9FLAO|nr:DinB family protein [Sinomicrobium weinanense]MBC9796363.1 DinB family protein [Sinomicrobium weinanense]MBU3122435.1 DinB family protein [Sinomicrobium weinanense]
MHSRELQETEYHSYYSNYVLILDETELMEALRNTEEELLTFIKELPEDRLSYRYAEGKWSIAEVIQHIVDTERIFTYRALRFARNDQTDLPGYEQNDYVPFSEADKRTKEELLVDFKATRLNTVSLFRTFSDEMLMRSGRADGNLMSVRAVGFIVSGHLMHHLKVLRERYM